MFQHAQAVHNELRVPAIPARGQRSDLDRMSQLASERSCERVAIGLYLREYHKPDDDERERKRREADHDGGPDKAEQHDGNRAGSAEVGAHGRHNGTGYCNGSILLPFAAAPG